MCRHFFVSLTPELSFCLCCPYSCCWLAVIFVYYVRVLFPCNDALSHSPPTSITATSVKRALPCFRCVSLFERPCGHSAAPSVYVWWSSIEARARVTSSCLESLWNHAFVSRLPGRVSQCDAGWQGSTSAGINDMVVMVWACHAAAGTVSPGPGPCARVQGAGMGKVCAGSFKNHPFRLHAEIVKAQPVMVDKK